MIAIFLKRKNYSHSIARSSKYFRRQEDYYLLSSNIIICPYILSIKVALINSMNIYDRTLTKGNLFALLNI